MKILRLTEVVMLVITFVACGAGGFFVYQSYLQNEELYARLESQQVKIDRVTEDREQYEEVHKRITSLGKRLSDCNEKLSGIDIDGYKKAMGSVENLSRAVFGSDSCDDGAYALRAIRCGNGVAAKLDELQDDVHKLQQDMLDRDPYGYHDLKCTVENLSKYVFGTYPKTYMTHSILDKSMQDQIQELNRMLKDIEWNLRYR